MGVCIPCDYTFDAAGRLTALIHARGGTTLAAYSWAYDAASRLTEFVSSNDGTATYTYDNADQLTGESYNTSNPVSRTYTYFCKEQALVPGRCRFFCSGWKRSRAGVWSGVEVAASDGCGGWRSVVRLQCDTCERASFRCAA